jgi:histidine triad (HIT) family protein
MSDCLFCKIVSGEIPSHKVYEDDHVVSFLDIHPVKIGHTLVIPKKHSVNLVESSVEDLTHVMTAVKEVMKGLIRTVDAEGFNVTSNIGQSAGQAVFHTHFHVIPRHNGDGLAMWAHKEVTQEELAVLAQRMR